MRTAKRYRGVNIRVRKIEINGKTFQLIIHPSQKKILVGESVLDRLSNAELNIIARKKGYFAKRLEPNILTIFYVPSWKCNLKCTYCFENSDEHLCEKTIDNAQWEAVIKEHIHRKNFSGINIVFFGGEPTLFLRECVEFYDMVFRISSEVDVYSSLVTNAYEICDDFISFCKHCKVSNIQITLDPGRKYHDVSRITKNQNGTYSKVVQNTKKLAELNLPITIRTNVDNDNIDGLNDLCEQLIDISKENTLFWSIAPIMSTAKASQEILKVEKVNKVIETIMFKIEKSNIQMVLWGCACDFWGDSLLVLSPDGETYNCVNFCKHGITKADIMKCSPMVKKCERCFWFTICDGGCKYQNFLQNDSFDIPFCMRPVFESIVMPIIINKIKVNLVRAKGKLKIFEIEL